ncbi:MAG: hypothetical protein HZC28_11065 [Spirochaetes bacterium]|nr:hypothetical protein [Spirochaetota bacterium]
MKRRDFITESIALLAAAAASLPVFGASAKTAKKKSSEQHTDSDIASSGGHYSLRPVSDRVVGYRPPAGAIGNGTWSFTYAMVICMPNRAPSGNRKAVEQGSLTITKRVREYTQRTEVRTGATVHTGEFTLSCGADGSLKSWKGISAFKGGEMNSTIPETGTQRDCTVMMNGRSAMYAVPASAMILPLPAVIDRIITSADKAAVRRFTFFDEACTLKESHMLLYESAVTLPLADGPVTFDVWRQDGTGIHPRHYWVDAGGRVLFITQGLRSYLLTACGS